MKINKKRPIHWILLTIFSANVVFCLLLTLFQKPKRNRILLYGHKLNGNLKALYDYYQDDPRNIIFFLSLDPTYSNELRKAGFHVLNAINPLDIYQVCRSRVIVTDHGPLSLILLIWLKKYLFIDVWHGIPYKGFDSQDFRNHHHYDYTLVTSDHLKQIYIDKFGFSDYQVVITGYGRTDQLVQKTLDPVFLKRKYGLNRTAKKVMMYAPTWNHNNTNHHAIPFEMEPNTFLEQLSSFATENEIICIFRSHLNSDIDIGQYSNIHFLPASSYPDTEELLYISDVLVCDWSSIAFDFLLLDRPALFIDSKPPFRKGLTLGSNYRYGPLIGNMYELISIMTIACNEPSKLLQSYEEKMLSIKEDIYGNSADGQATKRYAELIDSVA